MEIITKKYEVFTFEELGEEIKEKLMKEQVEKERECYCEFNLFDDMENTAEELLQEYFQGATFTKIYYDLGYSQGSGAQINFNINILDLNKKYIFLSKKAIKFIETVGLPDFKIKQSGWYYHEKAITIEWYFIDDFNYYDDFLTDDEVKTINEKIEHIINNDFYDDIVKMNRELTKQGYNFIEDDTAFSEMAKDYLNGERFLKDGTLF